MENLAKLLASRTTILLELLDRLGSYGLLNNQSVKGERERLLEVMFRSIADEHCKENGGSIERKERQWLSELLEAYPQAAEYADTYLVNTSESRSR